MPIIGVLYGVRASMVGSKQSNAVVCRRQIHLRLSVNIGYPSARIFFRPHKRSRSGVPQTTRGLRDDRRAQRSQLRSFLRDVCTVSFVLLEASIPGKPREHAVLLSALD